MDIIPPKGQPPRQVPAPPQTPSSPPPANYTTPVAYSPNSPQAGAKSKRRGLFKDTFHAIISTIGLFLVALFIAVILNTFVIQSYQVDGSSMEPTLQNNDRLIVNKIPRTISRLDGHQYIPKRGDVIIFNQDALPGFIGTKQLVKRVIGLPGERVIVNDGLTTVYNQEHPEGFNPDNGNYKTNHGQSCSNIDVNLEKDEIFVMGDNRPNSEDSRCFGPIKANKIVAKLVLRILPLNKAQGF